MLACMHQKNTDNPTTVVAGRHGGEYSR